MKTALIVGGTSGIGLGMVEKLLQRNINIFVIGRRDVTNNPFLNNNPRITHIKVDLSTKEAILFIKEKLFGMTLDYLVFCAATEKPLKNFPEIRDDDYDYAFSLNLKAPFFLTQSLITNLNSGARILFLTSRLSASPEMGSLIYCMTKSALEIFSKGLNKELAGRVLCSSIIPGVVDTEMQKRLREADPISFPEAYAYQQMQAKLLTIKSVSDKIVAHLCDSSDKLFSVQRFNFEENNSNLI